MAKEKRVIPALKKGASYAVKNYADLAAIILTTTVLKDDITNLLQSTGAEPSVCNHVQNWISYILPQAYGITHQIVSSYETAIKEGYSKLQSGIVAGVGVPFRILRNHLPHANIQTAQYQIGSPPPILQLSVVTAIPEFVRAVLPHFIKSTFYKK